jgi:hypothetical protein
MKLKHLIGPVALFGVLIVAIPAHAQGRRERGNRSEQNRGESAGRERAVPRSQPAERDRTESSTPNRGSGDRQARAPQNQGQGDRQARAPQNQGQGDRQARAPQNRGQRDWQARAPQNRGQGDRQARAPQNQGQGGPRADAYGGGNRYERPRTIIVQPRRAYGSYGYRPNTYTFRPRQRVGFGVFLGYPVPYPYYDPYVYPSRVYGGYPGPGYQVGPGGRAAYGGLSLDISPRDAVVYVDGTYVGVADDFYDPSQPLPVMAGRHRIQVQAPGYQPLIFDVDVLPGQVIPYQGDLEP